MSRCATIAVAAWLALVGLTVVFALGVNALSKGQRGKITNHATYAQVVANFGGAPYSTGNYVSGYSCAGYTHGKDGHGWVVIRCQK